MPDRALIAAVLVGVLGTVGAALLLRGLPSESPLGRFLSNARNLWTGGDS